MQSYIKYNKYYNKKAKASPLKEKDYCFILQPKADHQGSKIPFRDFRWIGPSLVEKALPNNNYIIRELNTNKTQILHRIRLRKYILEKPPEDYTQLLGKLNLVDTYLIFLSYIPTLTQLVLMIVTHRDQILLLSHVLIFMIQAMVKTRKYAPFLTHLYHKLQSLN